MKNKKWTKLFCLLLAVTLLVGSAISVAAVYMVNDVNGDGKINVFDAQFLAEYAAGHRQLTESQQIAANGVTPQAILDFILGDQLVDAGDTDADGFIEIYTVDGLQALISNPAGHFVLMNDLDLGGADWTPIVDFTGSFDGQGHTISNFTINNAVLDSRSSSVYNQGFFGDTAYEVVIKDLHLQNVTMNADAEANSIGFFVGTLRGHLTGCTVIGTFNDSREAYPSDVYTGIMVGRLATGSNGSIVGGTAVSISDETGAYTTKDLCANVKLNIVNKEINLLKHVANKVGLAGYAPGSYTVTGLWTDTTYSSSLLSETIQARQKKVVDYMTAMATVKWTPAQDLVYTANNGTDQTYKAGTVYSGLPYNGHNGSLERFLSVMDTQDENGVYTAQADLESGGWEASAIVKYFIRMYASTNSTTGITSSYITTTTNVPAETITFDKTNCTLCFTKDGVTYYLGATETNEGLHATGASLSQFPARLYTISNGRATQVNTPVANTAYKLGFKNADSTILFFAGEAMTINGIPTMTTTAEVDDATDVYLETVDGGYHLTFNKTGAWSDTGFYLTMGNDCSGAVNWAWMQVSNVLAEDVSSHGIPYKGGVYVVTTNVMIPNDANRTAKGIYQVGSWESSIIDPETKKWVSAPFDVSKAAYQCKTETYSADVLIANGIDTMLEAYAQTHKADAVVCFVSRWSSRVANGGHARLVAADPVVIRDAKGAIDPNASYMLLTEQGVGFSETSTSRWNVEKQHSFYSLLGSVSDISKANNTTRTYLPITIRALREDTIRDTYLVGNPSGSLTSPVSGGVYSYHHINSITVTVTDKTGAVYYNREAFTGIGTSYNLYRGKNNNVTLASLHADTYYAAAAEKNMKEGSTYYFTVDVKLSTGEVIRLVNSKSYKYTAPASE